MVELITYDLLARMGACEEGVLAFERQFPEGATFDEALRDYEDRNTTYEVTANADKLWFLCRCPANVKGATWEARVAAIRAFPQSDGQTIMDLAELARHCPWLDQGDTWDVRRDMQSTDEELYIFARDCPEEVEGATYEARAAIYRRLE